MSTCSGNQQHNQSHADAVLIRKDPISDVEDCTPPLQENLLLSCAFSSVSSSMATSSSQAKNKKAMSELLNFNHNENTNAEVTGTAADDCFGENEEGIDDNEENCKADSCPEVDKVSKSSVYLDRQSIGIPINFFARALQFVKTEDLNIGQMLTDKGQGEVVEPCRECRMSYVPGDDEHNVKHVYYHSFIYSRLHFSGWKNEDVIQRFHDGRVIRIQSSAPGFALQKAFLVKEVVDDDLKSAVEDNFLISDSFTFYLFIAMEEVVAGCLIAEHASKAYQIVSNPTGNHCKFTTASIMCGVNRLWTLKTHRRRKIATRLLDCLRHSFIYGQVIGIKEIAFRGLNPIGQMFAVHYVGPQFLVYK